MRLLDKLEKKLGRYAINNLSLLLIICYGFGYLMNGVNPSFMNYLYLNPYLITRGQIWRIVTWILVPPSDFGFFTLIMLYFYYSIGTTLERTWGIFKFNAYIFSGMLFTIIGSFILMGYCYLVHGDVILALGAGDAFGTYLAPYFARFSTYYMNMSVFFAFAMTFPDVQVLLFFIIPVKMKYLGIIDLVLLGYEFIIGGPAMKIIMGASLLNALVFFLMMRNMSHLRPKQIKRRVVYRQQVRQATPITRHKCAICGRTEKDSPELEFRFCSKCNGNYEYCNNHLFTHEHVK